MAVTIRDIARVTGVSVTTVSHALRGRGRVAPATRERILQTADELGYLANIHAQRLASGRSRTLAIEVSGFITPQHASPLIPDSAYFLDLLNGASATAAQLGYLLVLAPAELALEQLGRLAIDGAVIVDPTGDEPLLRALAENNQPLVTTGRPTRGQHRPPVVDNDHRSTAVEALDHMTCCGFSRPALITTATTRSYTADIVAAYQDWMTDRGMNPVIENLPEPPIETIAAAALGRLLDSQEPPDAIYASYDRLALGILQEAHRRKIPVPQQLGIASAVDSDALRLTSPPITGVSLYPEEIGREAIRFLVDMIENRERPGEDIRVPTTLIARESTSGKWGATPGASDICGEREQRS